MVLLCNQSLPTSESGGRAIDEVLAGLTEAQVRGQWQPQEASDERRLALLPTAPAVPWGALMVQPQYMQALDWI